METWMIIVAVVVLVAVIALAWTAMAKKRSDELQTRFGSEYEHLTHVTGKSEAEKALREREKRVSQFEIRELSNDQLQSFGRDWRNIQNHFVDAPEKTVAEADSLVQRVMAARGYPLDGFAQQAEDISVDHPEVVSNYRSAHEIAEASSRDEATTEDLRQAMIHYRDLFSDLLGSGRSAARAS